MKATFGCLILALATSCGTEDAETPYTGEPIPCEGAPAAARDVLARSCGTCHDAQAKGGFDHVLDRSALVDHGKVVPEDPEGSPLYRRIATGEMPPTGPLDAADQETVRVWIECGALPW